LALLFGTLAVGCGGEPPGAPAGSESLGSSQQPFINGLDDRREYYQLTDDRARAVMAQSIVALVPDVTARPLSRGNLSAVPTWGELNHLCPDQPFIDQPSAAFCSGVLVDWDLVLTSGHCVDIVPLRNLRVVFNYFFSNPGELALTRGDVYTVEKVILARDDQSAAQERLDYGWLRLSEPVRSPHVPAAVRTRTPELAHGDGIVAINAGGGVPFKLDSGGRVRDLREGLDDYFVADTDTSEGSSGGPAFNEDFALVGTLARGAPDFVRTSAGCAASDSEEDPRLAREQFSYVSRSAEGLCEVDPNRWLCDESCEDGCDPPPSPDLSSEVSGGCALSPPGNARGGPRALGAACGALLLAALLRRREKRGSAHHGAAPTRTAH
jgi:hypothetical protein